MLFELVSLLGDLASRPYAGHIIVLCVILYALRVWSNGPRNTRDRNMHGRVVVITGGFTPLGLRLITELAERGAQIIALTPSLADPIVDELIHAIRVTTKNELIYAEECDLDSPASIRAFCKQLIQLKPGLDGGSVAEPQRLDALILAHEYLPVTPQSLGGGPELSDEAADEDRLRPSLTSFLLTTLILPSLLRAPKDRDVRIIHVINPFYAAAVPNFRPPSLSPPWKLSIFAKEGYRSLRTLIYGRHLQRVLNALAVPKKESDSLGPDRVPESGKDETVRLPKLAAMSNITSIVVSPGFTAPEVGGLLLYRFSQSSLFPLKFIRVILYYVFIYPIMMILTKSTSLAAESVLYTLFLPHPRKMLLSFDGMTKPTSKSQEADRRTIEGGKLYRDYAVVRLPGEAEEAILDSEGIGKGVWEYFEAGIKRWEKEEAENLAGVVKDTNTPSPRT